MDIVKQNLGKVSITVEKDYWNVNKTYDRLTIVEVSGVGCYLSRKPVPANIDYTNREYWIKFSTFGEGGGSATDIVTEFGDSITLAIAQRTLTQRFAEIVNSIVSAINTSEQYTDGKIQTVSNEISTLGDDLSSYKVTNDGNIAELQQFMDTSQPELNFLDESIRSHKLRLATIDNAIRNLQSTDTNLSSLISELKSNILDIESDVANAYDTNISGRKILYIGGRITRQADDALLMNSMKRRLNKVEDENFFTLIYPFLNSSALVDLADGDAQPGGSFPGFNRIGTVIIQSDTTAVDAIGTAEDIPTTPNTSSHYAATLYGEYAYFIDKLHQINPSITVIMVAPPTNDYDDTVEGHKAYAIKDIANRCGALYVNPFISRYKNAWTSTTTINNVTKVILGTIDLYSWEIIGYWGRYIANKLLLHTLITSAY